MGLRNSWSLDRAAIDNGALVSAWEGTLAESSVNEKARRWTMLMVLSNVSRTTPTSDAMVGNSQPVKCIDTIIYPTP